MLINYKLYKRIVLHGYLRIRCWFPD